MSMWLRQEVQEMLRDLMSESQDHMSGWTDTARAEAFSDGDDWAEAELRKYQRQSRSSKGRQVEK